MKKTNYFLKVTTALMFVAFAWGFIDFVKADGRGVFKTLYQPQKNKVVAVAKDSFNEIRVEDFSRKAFAESIEPPAIKQSNTLIEVNNSDVDSIKKMQVLMRQNDKKLVKKLSYKSFSRGIIEMPNSEEELVSNDSTIRVSIDTIAQ